MNLVMLIAMPLLFAVTTPLVPRKHVRSWAMIGTLLPLAYYVFVATSVFQWGAGDQDQLRWSFEWFPSVGVNLTLAADAVSMLLIGLTVLLGPICVAASFTAIKEREHTYYGWLVGLQAAMTGVFAARDMVLFYTFFEFTLVPMFVLISLYGSTNRKAAAIKFFLYTFTGSIITLAGLVYLAWDHSAASAAAGGSGAWSFDFETLRSHAHTLPADVQAWLFWAMMLGFAVKVPLFPVHTWLPLAHTEAPTAGSVVLAGVLLKLGTYGIYKFALGFTPTAAVEFAPLIATLAVIGILYAALICWVQDDVKKLVAYSSVSHLGFCILGMFALNSVGLTGSVLYMINHGLSTGALFLLIGMMYERYHTRSMREVGGLAAKMPVWSTFMVFFAMASVGLPGLNGFVSEFMCLLGAFQAGDSWGGVAGSTGPGGLIGATGGGLGPWYAAIAGIGMILGAVYTLYMLGRVVWGKLVEPAGHGGHGHGANHGSGHGSDHHAELPADLTRREIGVLAPLAVLCIALGVYPRPFLEVLEKPTGEVARLLERARLGELPTVDRRVAPTPPAAGLRDEAAAFEDPPAATGPGTPGAGAPAGNVERRAGE